MSLRGLVLRVVGTRVLGAGLILLAILQILDLLDVTTDILDRGLGMGGVFYYATLRLPRLIEQVAPLCVLAGGLFAFAQLARENAVVAMRAAGVSVYRLVMMAAPVALCVMVIDAATVQIVAPRTDAVLEDWWQSTAPLADRKNPTPRPFRVGGDIVVATAGDAEGRRLDNIQIYHRNTAGGVVERIEAPSATFAKDGWLLNTPTIVRFAGTTSMTSTAAQLAWPSRLTPADVRVLFSDNPSPTAATARRALRGVGAERPDAYYQTRFQRAFASPFVILVMLLLTAPVAMGNFRNREGAVLTVAGLGAGLAFLVADGLLSALGESAALSSVLAAWTAPAVFAALAVTALLKMEG